MIMGHYFDGFHEFYFTYKSFFSKCLIYDKLYHFLGGAAGTMFLRLRNWPMLSIILSIFIGGLLWEIKDGFAADGFDWKDLVADSVGILVGLLV